MMFLLIELVKSVHNFLRQTHIRKENFVRTLSQKEGKNPQGTSQRPNFLYVRISVYQKVDSVCALEKSMEDYYLL